MSRLEENKRLCELFGKRAKETPAGGFEEIAAWQLGAISSYLADISRSLAVMADKVEPKEKATVAAESQNDDLDENQISTIHHRISDALKETIETREKLIRKTKIETLKSLKDEIIECYCKVENDYDHGMNYGLYMATQLIDEHLKETCE